MARPRSRHRKAALPFRAWVTEPGPDGNPIPRKPEDIDRHLQRRLEAIEGGMLPLQERLDRDLPIILKPVLPAAAWEVLLATPASERYAVFGDICITGYWLHTRERGRRLPRILSLVEPWDISSPNRIHVLDLGVRRITQALAAAALECQRIDALPTAPVPAVPTLDQLTAIVTILVSQADDLERFVWRPDVQSCRAQLAAVIDNDQRAREEREQARDLMVELDAAAHGDFKRDRSSSGEDLRRILKRFTALLLRRLPETPGVRSSEVTHRR